MNKSFMIVIPIVLIASFSVFALSPYFTESVIDEAIPANSVMQSGMESEMMESEMMESEMMESEMMESEMMESEMMESEMMESEMMESEMMEEISLMSFSGKFIGVGDGIHDAEGDVFTIPLEDESNVLRLENFKSTNGPDLYVYLSTDDRASEFINLGELKANKGNQNYNIPNDTDLSKYNKVLIWCKAFGVLFGSAELSSQ